jgi:urease accessory protein
VTGAILSDVAHRDVAADPGSGCLRIAQLGTRSVVTRAFATSPLRLLTPQNHGHAAWVFTSTYGGGLVGGDAVRLAIDVGPGATALLQTQASTKVYRSPLGASSRVDATVAEEAQLLVLPDPTVCFAGASYRQDQRVEVARGATLVLLDWMTAGRRGSGERWRFDRYDSRLTVRHEARTVLADAIALGPGEGELAARMGRFECVCLLVMIGPAVREHVRRAIETMAAQPFQVRADLLASAAPLGKAGCVIRMAGLSVEAVGRAAREHLQFIPALLGDDPWARKW